MAYPGLMFASAARVDDIKVSIFFMMWGLDILHKDKQDDLKFTSLGNTSIPLPQAVGGLPGMTALNTWMLKKKLSDQETPIISDVLTLLTEAGCQLYACESSMEILGIERKMLSDQVSDVLSMSAFIDVSKDGEIIFI